MFVINSFTVLDTNCTQLETVGNVCMSMNKVDDKNQGQLHFLDFINNFWQLKICLNHVLRALCMQLLYNQSSITNK